MGSITDEQIKFSVETAGIVDPSHLTRHLQTLQPKIVNQPIKSKVNDDFYLNVSLVNRD